MIFISNFRLISDVCNLIGFMPYNQEVLYQNENNKKIYKIEKEKTPIVCPNNWQSILDLDYDNCLEKLSS